MASDNVATPETPKAPTMTEQIQQYIQSLPSLLSAQQQYGPQFEQINYDTQAKFAPQYQALQQSLNPELTALTKQLTQQATAGAQNDGLPDYMRNQYLDQFRAEAGTNNGSGIGADYVSRNLLNQAQTYKQYNQNLGLSLTGQQPLYQATQAGQQAQSIGQGYNAGSALNYGASTYGNYVGAYSSMYGANAQLSANVNSINQGYAKMGLQGLGAIAMGPMGAAGGAAGAAGGGAAGGAAGFIR